MSEQTRRKKLYSPLLFSAITDGDNKYWNATLIDRVLSVFTLEKFKDYELEMSSNELILDIDFKCSSGQKRLQIYVTIKNVNSYTPEFGQEQYFIKIPTPLPKGFDVSLVMVGKIKFFKVFFLKVQFPSRTRKFLLQTTIFTIT